MIARLRCCAWLACALAFAAMSDGTRAQESLTELVHRGLVMPRTPDAASLVIESEEVAINPDSVVIRYRIVNQGNAPLSTPLTVPLPDLDFADPDVAWSIPGSDPVNFVGLTAKLDQKPVNLVFIQTARLNGKDVTSVLRQAKLALIPIGTFQNELATLPPDVRDKLANAGLIIQSGTDTSGNALYFPTWSVTTAATQKVSFAPGQPVTLELRQLTGVGVSPDSVLRKALRTEHNLSAEVQRYRTEYCIDDAFYTGLDRIASAAIANSSKIRERRLVFDLAAGAPTTPIKDFRLVVEKGRADRVVSFCLDNLKRVSPTAFEMRVNDFTPSRVLKVLLLGRD